MNISGDANPSRLGEHECQVQIAYGYRVTLASIFEWGRDEYDFLITQTQLAYTRVHTAFSVLHLIPSRRLGTEIEANAILKISLVFIHKEVTLLQEAEQPSAGLAGSQS